MRKFLSLLAIVAVWLLLSYACIDSDTKAMCPRCCREESLSSSCPWCDSPICETCNYSIQEDAEEDFRYLYYDGEEPGIEQGYYNGFEHAVSIFLDSMTKEEIEAWRENNAEAFDEYEYLGELFGWHLKHAKD